VGVVVELFIRLSREEQQQQLQTLSVCLSLSLAAASKKLLWVFFLATRNSVDTQRKCCTFDTPNTQKNNPLPLKNPRNKNSGSYGGC
jgi:hypothetical protein